MTPSDYGEVELLAATTPKFGTTVVLEGGKTYAFDTGSSRYLLTKRAMLTDDGWVMKRAAKPEVTKAMRKAAKAARRIAKAQKRESRELMLKAATAGDPRFNGLMREAVLRKAPETFSRGEQHEIAKGAYAAELTKAAYDNIGLGTKPVAGLRPGDWTTARGTASLDRMDIGGPVLGPIGIPAMPSQSVRNANIYGDGVAKDLPKDQMNAIVAAAREKFLGNGLQGANLADALASFVRNIRLNPAVAMQFAQIQSDASGSMTGTGGDRTDQGGDLGSRGGGRKKANPVVTSALTDRGAGATTRATSKAAKQDKRARKIAKRVKANAKRIAAAR